MEKIVVLDASTIPAGFPLVRPAIEHEWVEYPVTRPEEIVPRAKDATIVVTNKCKLTREVIGQLPALRFVAELATGFNNIDVACCRERGIGVANIQDYSTRSVAEHTFAMILTLARSFVSTCREVSSGAWQRSPTFNMLTGPIRDLDGRTLTVVGSGAIGSRIGAIGAAFGMRVLKAEHKGAASIREGYTEFSEALCSADFISVNCPLTPETSNLISLGEMKAMKREVILVNNARGGVVNEADLVTALEQGIIAGAAADVVSTEPLPADHPYVKLLGRPDFILTPHQAWMSDDCLKALCRQFAENVEAFCRGERLRRVD
ncbi:MAG: D-2-hydroxyacid dehydrogenase [Succinivibrionaceae bacterium]|nr:D-2-hydroxyacid dehydrogenase [Succinivibrionaceae bacterium]